MTTAARHPLSETALATLIPPPRRTLRPTRRTLLRPDRLQARQLGLQPAPGALWLPPLSMCIDDGPFVRAAGYRLTVERDRYRIAVWERMTNCGILWRYVETLEGEIVPVLWRAFGGARSWNDFPRDGSGPWGPGTDRVGHGGLIPRMEARGDLLPWDD